MSDKRRADMDTIELAQLPPEPSDSVSSVDDTSPIDTIISTLPGTPTIVPTDDLSDFRRGIRPLSEATLAQKRALADEKDAKEREKDAQRGRDEALSQQQREDALLRQQDQRQLNLLQKSANSALGAINSVKNGIGKIPTPVGLALPIITLLILFFLIVQVNGNSRFGWLWLVLTNNAYVEAGNSSSTSSSPGVSIPSYSAITTPLATFESTTTPLSSFAAYTTPLTTSAFVSLSQELN